LVGKTLIKREGQELHEPVKKEKSHGGKNLYKKLETGVLRLEQGRSEGRGGQKLCAGAGPRGEGGGQNKVMVKGGEG